MIPVMYRVTLVMQMAGSLTQSTPGVPLGVGGWMGGGEGAGSPRVSAVDGLK